jgi:Tfp pilus assembly protein PilF
MTIRRILCLGLIFSVLFAVACASTDNKQRKKEAEATRDLGEAYLRDRKFTLALKELLKAEKLTPNDHFLQNDLGLVYYYKKLHDKAIVHFKKSLDIKSDYGPAMNNLGNAHAAQMLPKSNGIQPLSIM